MRTITASSPSTARRLRRATAPAALLVALLGLSSCATAPTAATTATGQTQESAGITITDPWVKAAESGMTAGFGLLHNAGDEDLRLVAASTPAAESVELHETVDNGSGGTVMQEIDGGFLIAAGDTLVLEPGGNHLMLIGLTAPIVPGDEVVFTLEFDDGSTVELIGPAKDYAGANEEYAHDSGHSEDPEHSEDEEPAATGHEHATPEATTR